MCVCVCERAVEVVMVADSSCAILAHNELWWTFDKRIRIHFNPTSLTSVCCMIHTALFCYFIQAHTSTHISTPSLLPTAAQIIRAICSTSIWAAIDISLLFAVFIFICFLYNIWYRAVCTIVVVAIAGPVAVAAAAAAFFRSFRFVRFKFAWTYWNQVDFFL